MTEGNGSTEAALRKQRGLYEAPEPVVAYVTRSVHRLLQLRLEMPAGLADPRVRLLDPAAGELGFVLAACRLAMEVQRQTGGSVEGLVRDHLLCHFRGMEELPFAYANGLLAWLDFLQDVEYACQPDELIPFLGVDALAAPRPEMANINVLLGNPHWAGTAKHRGTWATALLRGYQLQDGRVEEGYFQVDSQPIGLRDPEGLQAGYVKYLRLAQWIIDQTGAGIVAFVVNLACLATPSFRGMRQSLLGTFEEIYALDLAGSGMKGASPDENVFRGAAQGAAILLLVKKPGLRRRVLWAGLAGNRQEKLSTLSQGSVETTRWSPVTPHSPFYQFVAAGDGKVSE